MIPYGKQTIDEDDIDAVSAVLRSDWLTTGPQVEQFEQAVAEFTGARHAVAISSGTAALHAAMHALRIRPGDEVIVPAITFVATANAVVYMGGTPVFADVEPSTLTVDPLSVEAKISSKTKAIAAVDYAGYPAYYAALREIADRHGLPLVADACHSLGATYGTKRVGTLGDLTVLSFHPVKHITTGEGGMVLTDDAELASRVRRFRNHGISTDHRQREQKNTFSYEMVELGFNYRITDFQCALGTHQLKKLPHWLERRRAIAQRYDAAFEGLPAISPLQRPRGDSHAYHLYVIRLAKGSRRSRGEVFSLLREKGIGANVHYLPVYLHPFYKEQFGYRSGLCKVAEEEYERILSLPIFPRMTGADVDEVVRTLQELL